MDTFFTIYFFIVGGLFILNLISVLIKFLTGDGEDWQFHLAEDVLNWCLYLYPIRKQKPLLTLVEGKSHLAGEYCFYNNTLNEKTAYISIIIGLIGGLLLFPAPDFSKSLLVGMMFSKDMFPAFVPQSLLFLSFLFATVGPVVVIMTHDSFKR